MAWRDQLGKVTLPDGRSLIGASFRGVPFFIENSEFSGGRRTARHEFPLRDAPFIEDLGRRARTFPVDGYVLGADYIDQRNALLAALEASGPGELVHPYYGTRRVMATEFRVRETSGEGGVARFGLTFEETEVAPAFPSAAPAGADLASASADAAQEAVGAGFLEAYQVEGQPIAALASLSSIIASASSAMESALGPVVTTTQQLAGVKRALDYLVLDADALVREPFKILGGFKSVLVSLASAPLRPSLGLPALLVAYGFTPESSRPAATTAIRQRERSNFDALVRLTRSLLVIQAARLAPTEAFDSFDAAVAARDSICDRLDEQLAGADDGSFAALEQLRADLVRSLPGEGSDLPRLVRQVPPFTAPSLVLAYQLYGDLELETDLVVRNRVVRPGFIPGGASLEVLTRDA